MLQKYISLTKQAKLRGYDSEAILLCGQLLSLNSQLIEKCGHNLNDFGLLEGRFISMLFISEMGEAAPHELATKTGLTRASITSVVDFLENKKFVKRVPSSSDRRSLSVVLEPAGTKILDEALVSQLKWLEGIMGNLNPEERDTFSKLLNKINH